MRENTKGSREEILKRQEILQPPEQMSLFRLGSNVASLAPSYLLYALRSPPMRYRKTGPRQNRNRIAGRETEMDREGETLRAAIRTFHEQPAIADPRSYRNMCDSQGRKVGG